MHDDSRPLLVFFYSERSGPARRMESLLAHLARKERERMRFRRVDVDIRPDLAALVVAALALIPGVGYLEALVLPALGARLRRRGGERYAGLRILARD